MCFLREYFASLGKLLLYCTYLMHASGSGRMEKRRVKFSKDEVNFSKLDLWRIVPGVL